MARLIRLKPDEVVVAVPWLPIVVSPDCRVPSPLVSTYARIVHPESGISSSALPRMLSAPSASRTPSPLMSRYLRPATVPPFKVGLIPRMDSADSAAPAGAMIWEYAWPEPPENCDAPLAAPHSLL